jgi:hypothetical protein
MKNRAANKADEPDGKNDAVLRKDRASLKGPRPAGYPQTLSGKHNEKEEIQASSIYSLPYVLWLAAIYRLRQVDEMA